jgi:hypothetical protein
MSRVTALIIPEKTKTESVKPTIEPQKNISVPKKIIL